MSNLLQACLYNVESASSAKLTSHISDLNFVRLVSEISCPEKLAETLLQTEMSLVFFHLDPDPGPVIEVIEQVSTRFPELALIAIGHQSDPAAIIGPMRAGCDQFVCEPIEQKDLSQAVARVASRRLAAETTSRTICVIGSSGGAGATTIACNLALEIGSLVERSCALVDLDLQFGDVALNFDCDPKYSILDLAESESAIDKSLLDSTMHTLECKVALLSRPERIEQFDAVSSERIQEVLERLAGLYENVVVDLPTSVDRNAIAAIGQADVVIIVAQLLVPSVRNAKRLMDTIMRLGVPEDRIEFVINRADGRSGRLTANDLADTVKKPALASVPNDFEFVARSIDIGRPIAALDRNSPVRAAIRQIARKIVSGTGESSSNPAPQPQGFLGRLFSK